MSGYPPVSPSPQLPEEFRFLCMLHNVGATRAERGLTVEEIAKWTNKELSELQQYLVKLQKLGYIQSFNKEGCDRYYVSVTGIRKVLTLYS